ncbi:MAG TPA: CmcI family methyltransferase [Candidatus Nitrosocosmicus sp.]
MNKATDILNSLDEMGKKRFIPSIGPVKGKIIESIILKRNPKKILEIGSLYGYSSILMANVVSNDNDNDNADIKVVTIEINKNNGDIAKRNIKDAELSNKIELITGDAIELIPELYHKFDLLFLDAAKDQYLKYLKLCEEANIIKKDATVIADNVGISKNKMMDYLEYVRNSGKYKSKTIETTLEFSNDIRDAIEFSIRVG